MKDDNSDLLISFLNEKNSLISRMILNEYDLINYINSENTELIDSILRQDDLLIKKIDAIDLSISEIKAGTDKAEKKLFIVLPFNSSRKKIIIIKKEIKKNMEMLADLRRGSAKILEEKYIQTGKNISETAILKSVEKRMEFL